MHDYLRTIYQERRVIGRSGQSHPLQSGIDPEESDFLAGLIEAEPSIRRTLEVGCAYGLSSLAICSATRGRADTWHTIVDPLQSTRWDGVGTRNLDQIGISSYTLMEIGSELGLPKLLEAGDGQFDLVFIDGWHTFDHTLLDCFYATRLLRVGGLLVIDDLCFPAVQRVVDLLGNYPCYETAAAVDNRPSPSLRGRTARALLRPLGTRLRRRLLSRRLHRKLFGGQRMIALRKTGEDERSWDWHTDAF